MDTIDINRDFSSTPRFKKLVLKTKLPANQVVGCCFQVWSACASNMSPFLSMDDVDAVAEIEGFAMAMVAAGLADTASKGDAVVITAVIRKPNKEKNDPGEVKSYEVQAPSDGVRIRGSADRIRHLFAIRERSAKGVAARQIKKALKEAAEVAESQRVNPGLNPEQNPMVNPAVNHTVNPLPCPSSPSLALPSPPEEREKTRTPQQLAEELWNKVSEARVQIAAELRITGVLALPAAGPVQGTQSFRDLKARIREEGDHAAVVCEHVFKRLVAQARDTRSVEWLAEKAFSEGGWRTARTSPPSSSTSPPSSSTRPGSKASIGPASPRSDHPESTNLVPIRDLLK